MKNTNNNYYFFEDGCALSESLKLKLSGGGVIEHIRQQLHKYYSFFLCGDKQVFEKTAAYGIKWLVLISFNLKRLMFIGSFFKPVEWRYKEMYDEQLPPPLVI